jgi:hypothetical protein
MKTKQQGYNTYTNAFISLQSTNYVYIGKKVNVNGALQLLEGTVKLTWWCITNLWHGALPSNSPCLSGDAIDNLDPHKWSMALRDSEGVMNTWNSYIFQNQIVHVTSM